MELEHEEQGNDTPKEIRRQRYAREFEALRTAMFHSDDMPPLIQRQESDPDLSDPDFSLPGVVDEHQDVTTRHGLTPPTRLSPLSHSLVEHFDMNIRIATSPSSSVMNTVMREAARAAQSTDTASKRLPCRMFTVEGDDSSDMARRAKSQSPIPSPVTRTPARRVESDVTNFRVNGQSGRMRDKEMLEGSVGSQSSDEDGEGSSVLELLITGSPQSQSHRGQRTFVSAATVAHKMHTTTLEEDVGRRASNHTHTCTATLSPSESQGMERSTGSLASLREDISGLMERFDEQISVLETPPGSPAFVRRRTRSRMKHKKTRSADNLATKAIMERPVDSAVQSLDSLLSTSEELLTSPLPCDPGTSTSSQSRPAIRISSEEERGKIVQVKTEWRGDSSTDAVSCPGEEIFSSRATHRDSGISVPPDTGTTGSVRTPETSPVAKRKTRKPAFV